MTREPRGGLEAAVARAIGVRREEARRDPSGRACLANALREHLGREDRRLRGMFLRHELGGRGYVEARTRAVDAVVAGLWSLFAPEGSRGCLLACGGYGRREMAPFSDIDLTFLFPEREEPPASLVEGVLYVLWDMGLTAGHATRTPAGALSAARDDLATFTTLLESRRVAGDDATGSAFRERFRRSVGKRGFREFLQKRMDERSRRLSLHDGSLFLLEPNLKEGAGGLRDTHLISWLGALSAGRIPAEDWPLSPEQEGRLLGHREFLLSLRIALHLEKGRREDVLDVDAQPRIARMLRFPDRPPRSAVERMMSRYYRTAREVQGFLQLVSEQGRRDRSAGRWGGRALRGGFTLTPWGLDCGAGAEKLPWTASRIMDLFALSQETGAPLRPRLKDAVRTHLPLVDRRYRSSEECSAGLLSLLEEPSNLFATLSSMHETGVLVRVLPEFGRVNALVQHDRYHHYTIDEHSLMTVKAIARLASASDPAGFRYAQLLASVPGRRILFLAALLHDVGKAHGSGHAERGAAIGRQVARRLGLAADEQDLLTFLIANHLEMAHTSQRRDLEDPEVIRAFAAVVGDPGRLSGLMLLTYADLTAIGPGVMTEWKESLLWELFARTLSLLEGKGDTARGRDLLAPPPPGGVSLTHRPGRVGGTTEIDLVARDRIGLFALLVGAMTAERLNILRATLRTGSDGLAVDTFLVEGPTPPHPIRQARLDRLAGAVRQMLSEGPVPEEGSAPWLPPLPGRGGEITVSFDNRSSAGTTIMEITAPDARGLLHAVALTLAGRSIDVRQAIIATEKRRAHDVFSITAADGSKIVDPAQLAEIGQGVVAALSLPARAPSPPVS